MAVVRHRDQKKNCAERRQEPHSAAAFFRALAPIIAFLLLLLVPVQSALALDPRLEWRTLETTHFSVHFHGGLEIFAARAASYAEEAWSLLVPVLEAAPKEKIQIVIGDTTDSANGSATVYPRSLIRLNPIPPNGHSELSDTEDWLWTLIVHELTHILHMSDIRGLPGFVNRLMGRLWIPNSIQPNWIVEGFAIQSESRFSTGGRNRSSLYDMHLRLMALEDAFPDLDDVSGSPSVWPRGTIPYLCGARFVDWLVRANGPDTMARLSHHHASNILPLWRNLSQASVVGKSWRVLFQEWRRFEEERASSALERISSQGATEFRIVTRSGENTGSPQFCRPSGREERLCYIDSPGTRRPSIRSVPIDCAADAARQEAAEKAAGSARGKDCGGDAVHGVLLTNGEMTVSPDGKTAVVSQTVAFETDYSFKDLYAVDLSSGRRTRLTEGLRAEDPSYTPDGKSILFVRRERGGTESICLFSLGDHSVRRIFTASLGESLSTPVMSPDMKSAVFSRQTLSGRAIERIDLSTSEVILLTESSPRAMRIDPAFSPDGRFLVYSGDESGIYDLFRIWLSGHSAGTEERMTRVISGAFSPVFSSDGKYLAFVVHSSRGSDIALAQTDALKPLNRDPVLDRMRGEPSEFLEKAHRSSEQHFSEASAASASHPYRPWKSVGPYTWMPELESDADGQTIGISLFGEDAVGLHSWKAIAGLGLESHQPYASASYTWRGIRPSITFGLSSYYGRGYWASWFPERQWSASVSASYPVSRENYALVFNLGISATLHQALGTYRASPNVSMHPENAFTTLIRGSAAWSNAWTPPRGISPSEGWSASLSASASSRALGSDRNYAAVSASLTRYLAMPWHDLHVLALRLRGGIGWSEREGDGLFSLSGAVISNPITDYIDDRSASSTALRGYKGTASIGDRFLMASAEYRLPIASLDCGLWTLPLYFRRLHGALTADLGWTGIKCGGEICSSDLLPSVGAVLRSEVLVAYDTMTQIQFGYAYGLGNQGTHNIYLGIGSGF